MTYMPAKMIRCSLPTINEKEWIEDGAIAVGWELVIAFSSGNQGLGKYNSVEGDYNYGARDVVVGDWVADWQSGYALEITSITSVNDSSLTCQARDTDFYNQFSDLNSNRAGALSQGSQIYIFSLGEDGLPVVGPMTDGWMPSVFQANLLSHFLLRNPRKKVQVSQANHGLSVGNTIFIDTDGKYKTMAASRLFKDKFDQIVGVVTDVGFPYAESFTYKPRGDYRTADISASLPTMPGDATGAASVGRPIYLDPNNNGGMTLTKPSRFALPLYIRLPDGASIFMEGGGSAAAASGPLGYYTTTYNVATITDRNALLWTDLEPGDLCFVANDGTNHWAKYIVSAQDQTTSEPTWTLLIKETASTTDAKTAVYTFAYDINPATFTISEVAPGSSVNLITIEVQTPFSNDAILTIGDSINNSRLVTDLDVDLSVIGTYKIQSQYTCSGQQYTLINGYFTIGTSTAGQAKITLSFV